MKWRDAVGVLPRVGRQTWNRQIAGYWGEKLQNGRKNRLKGKGKERKSPSHASTVEEVRVGRTKSSRTSIMDSLETLKALRWSSKHEFVVNQHTVGSHAHCRIKESHLSFSFPKLYFCPFSEWIQGSLKSKTSHTNLRNTKCEQTLCSLLCVILCQSLPCLMRPMIRTTLNFPFSAPFNHGLQ